MPGIRQDGPMPLEGFRTDHLRLTTACEDDRYETVYEVDGRPPARLTARMPGPIPPGARAMMDAGIALYLGSLALARDVSIEGRVPAGLIRDLLPIGEMLYDIRRWRDDLPLGGPPRIQAPDTSMHAADSRPDPATALLLWSGGKDSTLGLMTLRANGYAVVPVHASINVGTEEPERQAIAALSRRLDVKDIGVLEVQHPDFLDFSSAFATAWDAFPVSNRVPFGRDLLLACLALPWALHHAAGSIALGHDWECRNAYVEYRGKRVPRNDIESAEAALIVERAIRRYVDPGVSLLPPVANLAELRILRDMIVDHPAVMAEVSFCFWGGNCGRCAKCLRYYLADRVFGSDVLRFAVNPLSPGSCPELADLLEGREELFERQVLLLLGRLAAAGDIRAEEDELERFRVQRLASVAPLLNEWERELLAERGDPQVPIGFRPLSATASTTTSMWAAGHAEGAARVQAT